MMWFILVVIIAWLQISDGIRDGQQYTSDVGLNDLLKADKNLTQRLNQYLNKTTNEHVKQAIKKYIKVLTQFTDFRDTSDPLFFHPINGYHFLKHVIHNWKDISAALKQDTTASSEFFLKDMIKMRMVAFYPPEEDLFYAAASISRMQYFYNMSFQTLVQGIIVDNSTGKVFQSIQPLTSWDCYEISRGAIEMNYSSSIEWLDIAIEKVEGGDTSIDIQTLKRDKEKAIAKLDYLNSPETRAERRRAYNESLEKSRKDPIHKAKFVYDTAKLAVPAMAALCRGEAVKAVVKRPPLSCRYFTRGDPLFTIGPLKLEELARDPMINTFHDFMMENEMQKFVEVASPRLLRQGVTKPKKTWDMADYMSRTSKQDYIRPDDDPKIETKVTKRIAAATGLLMEKKSSTELYQVVNYGIAGTFDPHVDALFTGNRYTDFKEKGERIATFSVFIGNVTSGGSTVFPLLGLAVPPQRGAGLFFVVTFKSGEADILSMHAGCPVVYGSKWVTIKFIRNLDQMFQCPCGLKHNEPIQLY